MWANQYDYAVLQRQNPGTYSARACIHRKYGSIARLDAALPPTDPLLETKTERDPTKPKLLKIAYLSCILSKILACLVVKNRLSFNVHDEKPAARAKSHYIFFKINLNFVCIFRGGPCQGSKKLLIERSL